MKKWLTLLLPFFFLGACTMPETSIYRLHLPANQGRTFNQKGDAAIAVSITSPRHLAQPYIVYSKSPYELEISRYSKWDTSPNERIREVFKDAIGSIKAFKEVRIIPGTPEGFYSLKIGLRKFERSETEKDFYAELLFDVTFISPDGKELYQSTISKKSKLNDRTFLSLAKGLSDGLAEGVEEVRNQTEKFLQPVR
jgi:uncharacterized lipoprotein YmbA